MKDIDQKSFKILYTTSFGHMMGGGQWSLYYLIKHLNKDIFHPVVLCPEEGELAEKMRRVGAEVVCLDVGRIRHLNLLVIKKFISIIRGKEIDLIHTDSPTETFYAGVAAKVMRIPLIWHIRVSEREWFADRVLSLLSTRLILVANAITQRFGWLKDSKKMIVVHNGIDLEEFDKFLTDASIRKELNINKKTVLLGCIGRIEERKGQRYLIAAMRHVDKVKLILVGNGEKRYLKRIQALCKDLGLSDRVIHIGYRNNVPSLLKEIDLLVFPTISGEGFPRVILEAMAAGKPVVATDNAGNPEAVEDGKTGYIVPAGDIEAMATKIMELLTTKRKREEMGQASRKRIGDLFTIQQHVKKIQRVYHDVLEGQ